MIQNVESRLLYYIHKMRAKQWPVDLITWRSLRTRTIPLVQWGKDNLKVSLKREWYIGNWN